MSSRATPQQIELMVAFMERHGDLNRAHQIKDRVQIRKLWGSLEARLGALTEPGCRPRSLDKWKKTWSDIKNNVKRKAARIAHPELRPPSLLPAGRAAPPLRLSRLDVRVLALMGLIQRTSALRKVAEPRADVTDDTHTADQLEGADPLTEVKAEDVEFEVERAASDEEFLWPEAAEPAPGDAPDGAAGQGAALQEVVDLLEEEVVEEVEVVEEPEHVETSAEVAEVAEVAAARLVRPDRRGHTSTRAPGGVRPVRRGAGLRRALAALLRAEAARDAARARRERARRAAHRTWQALCAKGLALLERLADRSERYGERPPPAAAGARESEESEERPMCPRVMHPDRIRP